MTIPLVLEFYDRNGRQYFPAARNLRFTKTFFGGEDVSIVATLNRDGSKDYPDIAYGNDIILRRALLPIFSGEMRQIETDVETIGIAGIGKSVHLNDYGYGGQGKLWCDSRYGRFRPLSAAIHPTAQYCIARYMYDDQDRLYMAPKRDEMFGFAQLATGGWSALWQYDEVQRISFDYDVALPANWRVQLRVEDAAHTLFDDLWVVAGVTQTGVKDVVVPAGRNYVEFWISYNAVAARYAGETGAVYMRITNLRLWGESGPLSRAIESPSVIHIAESIISQIQAATPISADDDLVQESLFVRDTFTGNAVPLHSHSPDVNKNGNPWIDAIGDWDIVANQAISTAFVGVVAVAVIDAGVSDGIVTVDLTTLAAPAHYPGFVFRYLDTTNYWFFYFTLATGFADLGYYSGGVWNSVWSANIGIEYGYTYNLMVKLRGDRVDAYIGGVWRCGTNNSFNQTQTKHGIRCTSQHSYFDNFEVFQALPIWPLFYEGGESCYEALQDAVSFGDWNFRPLGWGVKSGGDTIYLRQAYRSKVRYIVPQYQATRLSARGQTSENFVTEAWGKYITEDGVEYWTPKYYAYVTGTGITVSTVAPVTGDNSAENVYGVKRDRTISFGRVDAKLAVEYLVRFLMAHAYPQVTSTFEVKGPIQDLFKGSALIDPCELEMGYLVQIPYYRAVEAEGPTGSDIRDWGTRGTTFLMVGMEYDVERGTARLIPEHPSQSPERVAQYAQGFEEFDTSQKIVKRPDPSFSH